MLLGILCVRNTFVFSQSNFTQNQSTEKPVINNFLENYKFASINHSQIESENTFSSLEKTPNATITLSGSSEICTGSSVMLTVNPGDSYLWSNGETSQSIIVSKAGNYWVVVTTNGVLSTSSIITTTLVTPPVFSNINLNVQTFTNSNSCNAQINYPLSVSQTLSENISFQFTGATILNGLGTGTNNTFNKGITLVKVTAINSCETKSQSFQVKVIDNKPPIAIAKPKTVYLNSNGDAFILPSDINNNSYDNCGQINLEISTLGLINGMADENGSVTLTAPPGAIISQINFASFGTPTESIGSFSIGTCHATTTLSIVSNLALGQNTVTIPATNSLFGNPCSGVQKRLYIQATYSGWGDTSFLKCNQKGINNIFLRVIDASWNVTTAISTVTLVDNIMPSINCPQDITVNATSNSGAIVNYNLPTGSDNCLFTISRISGLSSGSIFPIGTSNIIYEIKDASGNKKQCSFSINVLRVAPVINCPSNIITYTDLGICGTNVNYLASEITAIPSSFITYSQPPNSFFPVGNTSITAIATNSLTNSTCSFIVIVKDTIKPTIICNANIETNATSTLGANVIYNLPIGNDNCSFNIRRISGNASGTIFPIGNTIVTHEIIDESGNKNECSFTVTAKAASPRILCPQNITVYSEIGLCAAKVNFTAIDTIAVPSSTITYSLQPGTLFSVGNSTITAISTNVIGSDTCSFTITVIDSIAPIINCPSNIIVNAANSQGAIVNYSSPIGSDNCSFTIYRISGLASGSFFPIGESTVTYEIKDASGNISTCSFQVKVNQIQGIAPIIICPSSVIVSNESSLCGAKVNFNAIDTTAFPLSTITYSHIPGSFFPIGITLVTATSTNSFGSSTCTFKITVNDTLAPIILTKNISVEIVDGVASISPTQIDNGSYDNCGIKSMSVYPSTFSCSNQGDNQVTLTVTDINGNVRKAFAIVNIIGEVGLCTINSVPTSSTYTDGISTNIYLGYGAQSTTLKVNTPQEGAPFTYTWSGNNLNNQKVNNPVFVPTKSGKSSLMVEVKNKYGCKAYTSITICVLDARVYDNKGNATGKVYICHKTPGNNNKVLLEVNANAIAGHLQNQGNSHNNCKLGVCLEEICNNVITNNSGPLNNTTAITESLELSVYPNPAANVFRVKLISNINSLATIRVINSVGKLIGIYHGVNPGTTLLLGDKWEKGNYYLEAIQEDRRRVINLLKIN